MIHFQFFCPVCICFQLVAPWLFTGFSGLDFKYCSSVIPQKSLLPSQHALFKHYDPLNLYATPTPRIPEENSDSSDGAHFSPFLFKRRKGRNVTISRSGESLDRVDYALGGLIIVFLAFQEDGGGF